MRMKQLLMAILAVGFIATTAMEWKKTRAVQERARLILYPGNVQEILEVLTALRSHRDPESQALVRQLEDRLQRRGHRLSRRVSRRTG